MEKKFFVIGIVFILIFIGFSGCEEKKVDKVEIAGKGEIQYIDLEGGFYGIVSDDGKNYDPINLSTEFKEDGLPVNYTLELLKNEANTHMWGFVVKIIKIEMIKSDVIINTTGNLTNYSGCKEFFTNYISSEDCIEYQYDGENILLIKHINAAFNCCPKIDANINISNNIIKIEEIEISGDCNCICLYDLNYEIKELKPGEYTIKVIEQDIPNDEEILEFIVDLTSKASGTYCVERNQYPWK
jgi:hypothetical protein